MPKFYVSSGNFHLIIEADHSRAAAIWAVHRCLSAVTPFVSEREDERTLGENAVEPGTLCYEAAEPQRRLGHSVHVSEQGFGGADEQELATLPVVAEWSRLLVALDRLQQGLQAAAG
jgi:hypothetical protein